jgi:hypothetical protein
MKRKITAVIILLCLTAAFILPGARAADYFYFSVFNNKIFPLNDKTMPVFIDDQLYLPYSFFSSSEASIFSNAGGDMAMIYSSISNNRLTFDVSRSTIINQDRYQYTEYSPKLRNNTIYVPAQMVCDFFGLTLTAFYSEFGTIIRVRSASNHIPDSTFPTIGYIKDQLETYYNAYTVNPNPSPAASPSPTNSPTSSPTTSADVEPTYQNVTIYLSFYDLSGGKMANILDALKVSSYKCCFFVAEDEIAANADLLRRAAGEGHMIGIWLKDGTYAKYQDAAARLFEAAKVKTVIVSAGSNIAEAAKAMAASKGLIFWRSTRSYPSSANFTVSSVTGKLSTVSGAHESLNFAASNRTSVILPSLLSYLSQYKYNVRRICETSVQ